MQNFKNKISQYPFYFYANIEGLAQTLKDKENGELMDLISATFSKFELQEYTVEKNNKGNFCYFLNNYLILSYFADNLQKK